MFMQQLCRRMIPRRVYSQGDSLSSHNYNDIPGADLKIVRLRL
jgi:hypothetical protein